MNSRSEAETLGDRLVDFGTALRAARTEKKIRQTELAEHLGTTQSQVSAYEAGENVV